MDFLAALTYDSPFVVLPSEERVESFTFDGFLMLDDVAEFACTDRSCAPPPVGTGGSRSRPGIGAVEPSVKKVTKSGVAGTKTVNMDPSKVSKTFWDETMVKSATRSGLAPTSAKTGDQVVEHFAGNIRRMYKVIDIHAKNPIVREQMGNSEKWYPAAGEIADSRGKQFGFSKAASAAALAALSPGHDWDSNIREHEIVMRVVAKNAKVDASSLGPTLRSIFEGQLKGAKSETSRSNAQAKLDGLDELMARVDGKPFNSLSVEDRARILKAHAMLTEGKDMFTSEKWVIGDDGAAYPDGFRYNLDGSPKGISFQTEGTWAGVFRILDADRAGVSDMELQKVISTEIGDGAKVRSFFNNIMFPDSPQRDVTIDTHATSVVTGRRVAQTSTEYKEMSGGITDKTSGFRGPYIAAVEAYRSVADERGIAPRAAQSQTWVAQKGINDALAGNPTTESLRKTINSSEFKGFSPEAREYLRKELEIREAWLETYNSAREAGDL